MGLFDKLRKAFGTLPEEQQDAIKEVPLDENAAKEQLENTQQTSEKQADLLEEQQVVDENKLEPNDIFEVEDKDSKEDTTNIDQEEVLLQATEIKQVENIQKNNDEKILTSTSEFEAKQPTEMQRYDKGLEKSRKGFGAKINALLANFRSVDEDFFEELEETLIEADVGFETAMNISEALRQEVKLRNAKSKADVSDAIIEKLVDLYEQEGQNEDNSLHFAKQGPTVILFVGVNGVGKTTTIGKLAHRYQSQGKKVLLAACDTFRAGAIQQLVKWGERVEVEVVQKPEKSDPAAVAFDAVKRAKQEDYDILLVDTAGRLQNKVNLMNELAKIKRILQKEIPDAPHEVLLALDATTGQNALTQAKQFKEVTDVSGIVLTKLDGTARGGIVLAIRNELHLPVKLVGLGEGMNDLRDFNAQDFVYGLFKGLVTPKKD